MTTPAPGDTPARPPARPPSLVPGIVLLLLAAVLIVVVLVDPGMAPWLRTTVAIASVVVVLALLVYAFRVFRGVTRPRGDR